jgi:hypothetical protein
MAVGFVASASSGSQASVASFNIGTLGTGARAGIVFVATHGTGDLITGVTWNGVAMSRLFQAVDTDTEPGSVVAYFLDNVTNGTITVSRTNNAVVTVGYAASISATGKTAVTQTITRVSSTQNTNANTSTTGTGASGEVNVDDGTRPTDSMRFAAAYSGAATPPLQGANSTNLQLLDSTALGSRFVRETNAGVGSRPVGFATGTTDDWALVAVAVSEIDVTGTGAISVPSATVSGTGSHVQAVTGTGAISVPTATVAGTGVETFTATGAVTVPTATVAGTGAETFTATGAIAVPSATVAGTGAETFTATGAVSVPPPVVTGTGEHTEASVPPEGTGAITVPTVTVAGTGELILTATGAVQVPPPAVAGTGVENFTATGAISVPAPAVAGTGTETFTATGAISVPAITIDGTGDHSAAVPPSGTGAITVPAVVVAGTGLHVENVTGTGAIVVPAALISGSGTGGDTSGGHPGRRQVRPIRIRRLELEPEPVLVDEDAEFILLM